MTRSYRSPFWEKATDVSSNVRRSRAVGFITVKMPSMLGQVNIDGVVGSDKRGLSVV
jgi:hypothetical protein